MMKIRGYRDAKVISLKWDQWCSQEEGVFGSSNLDETSTMEMGKKVRM